MRATFAFKTVHGFFVWRDDGATERIYDGFGDSTLTREVVDRLISSVAKACVGGGWAARALEHGASLGNFVEVVRRGTLRIGLLSDVQRSQAFGFS